MSCMINDASFQSHSSKLQKLSKRHFLKSMCLFNTTELFLMESLCVLFVEELVTYEHSQLTEFFKLVLFCFKL